MIVVVFVIVLLDAEKVLFNAKVVLVIDRDDVIYVGTVIVDQEKIIDFIVVVVKVMVVSEENELVSKILLLDQKIVLGIVQNIVMLMDIVFKIVLAI